jgi:hypothetical protein
MESLKCSLNENHVICQSPTCFKCESENNEKYVFACKKCVESRLDYSGALICPNCKTKHKIVVKNSLRNYQNKIEDFGKECLNSLVANLIKTNANLKGKYNLM